jgi:hypothetical protein
MIRGEDKEHTREYDRYAEQEKHSCYRESMLRVLSINLGPDDRFANQSNSNSDRSPDQRFSSANTIDHEYNENEI